MLEACAWRCICSMASTLKKLALQAGVRIQGTMHSSRTGWKRRLLMPCACACRREEIGSRAHAQSSSPPREHQCDSFALAYAQV